MTVGYPNLSLDEFLGLREVILIDCEFTCWEDSLATGWSDPGRPPEVIEIGLAMYAFEDRQPRRTFACFVRPRLNPELSAYCRRLGGIPQSAIDDAPRLPDVIPRLTAWLRQFSPGTPTCGWGPIDRDFVAQDATRSARPCPFGGRPHANVRALCESVLGRDPGSRDSLRAEWQLAANARRHRALDDAVDMVQFVSRVRGFAGSSRNA